MKQLPPTVKELHDNFIKAAEIAGLKEPKKTVLLNCYINKETIGSVYPQSAEDSIKAMKKFMKINNMKYELKQKKY
tara:strand:- start:4912 stop:5139 length:228 start_codon:yes stop_codon:yes gene_type:complete